MNKTLSNVIMFTVGAAIGSVVTWKVVKTKYEQIAQEEIDSVKESFDKLNELRRKEIEAWRKIKDARQVEESDDKTEDESSQVDDSDVVEYHKLTNKYRGSEDDESEDEENDEKGDEGNYERVQFVNGPYVISPDTFGDEPKFNAQPLNYYADGILSDDWGVELDIEETIGEDALNHFGEYADDTVYVRNERTEIDYEVTRDPRTYEEAQNATPRSR